MRYREYSIYTERFDNLPTIVARHFDGATLVDSIGLWQGNQENSAVITLLQPAPLHDAEQTQKVSRLAEDIRRTNRQAEVWITWRDVNLMIARAYDGPEKPDMRDADGEVYDLTIADN